MKGYIARDKEGNLFLYRNKPVRLDYVGTWTDEKSPLVEQVREDDYVEGYFKRVTWEGDPIEVCVWHDPIDGWLYVDFID